MCLYISEDHWSPTKRVCRAKTAKSDIEVYKLLYRKNIFSIKTPFQMMPIRFNPFKRRAILKEENFFSLCLSMVIYKGIHSATSKEAANEIITTAHIHPIIKNKLCIYKAIIPKGAKYYLGKNGDIVSDKLIIYNEWSRP